MLATSLALLLVPVGDEAFEALRRPAPLVDASAVGGTVVGGTTGDVNGDGTPDAVIVQYSRSTVLLGDGHGGFSELVQPAPLQGYADDPVLFDADGDLDLDLLSYSTLYLNDGSGSFSASGQTFWFGDQAVGDVDGDGDLDLYLTGRLWYADLDQLYLNDGTGTFSDASSQLPGVATYSEGVALGDADGDGDLDVVLAVRCDSPNPLRLLENDGAGNFTDASASLPVGAERITSGRFVDLDGDGALDLLLGLEDCAIEEHRAAVFLNDGTGTFAELNGAITGAPDLGVTGYSFGDVDGDGDTDLWTGDDRYFISYLEFHWFGAQSQLFLNDGSGVLVSSPTVPQGPDVPSAGELTDLDGDGDLDLWIAERRGAAVQLGDGTGNFVSAEGGLPETYFREATGFGVGDADGDGNADIFVTRDRQEGLAFDHTLLFGDGSGAFTEAAAGSLPATQWDGRGGVFGDFDSDGDNDLFVQNFQDSDFTFYSVLQDNYLWENDGTGTFTDVTSRLPLLPFGDDRGTTQDVHAVDLDGDADLDLVVSDIEDYDGGNDGLDLYINDGSGTFSFGPQLSFGEFYDTAPLDVEGDGDLDLVSIARTPNRVQLWINDGAGNYAEESGTRFATYPFSYVLFEGASVEVGDLDGDSDTDLVVNDPGDYSGPTPSATFLFANDGSGSFSQLGSTQAFGHYAVADIEADGDLDLIGGTTDLLGDGAGGFVSIPSVLPSGGSNDVSSGAQPQLVDFDLDGDPDLFGGRVLWTNTTRQLAWSGFPRIGHPLTIDIDGPSSGYAVLLAASSLAATPAPTTLGLAWLDGASIFLVRLRLLDGSGEKAFSANVPTDPGLVGATIYWQAVVGPGDAFTNYEPTTLAGF